MIVIVIVIVLIVLSIIAGFVYKKVAADAEAAEAEAEAALKLERALEQAALEQAALEQAEELEAELEAEALAAAPVSFDGKVLNSIKNPSQCMYMQNNKKVKLGLCKYSKKDTGPYSLHLNGTLRSHDLMKTGVDKCITSSGWSASCDKGDTLWDYIPETKQLKNKKYNKCLTTNNKTWHDLYASGCDASLKNQQWGYAE
jgi:type II secretory pathway pseudopilin PulG